jgi:pimeloyl-ACP methyl ester carboxylesterase
MLAWALFSKDFDLCTVRERACVENVLMNLKLRFAVNAPEGYNPAVKAMLLTLEPIQYVHRPLAFYMSLTTVQVAGDAVLTLFGFSRHEINGIAYWYRSPKKVALADRSQPLVFFHGISPGLNLYVLMVHVLAANRKAVLVEVPHIAMCLNFQAKRLGDMVKTVEIITRRHRMSHFAVAGHSFGSLCAAWVVKHLKGAVRQLILLDPVCLLLGLPDVSYNFLYKKPRTLMEYILHYGGSTVRPSPLTLPERCHRHKNPNGLTVTLLSLLCLAGDHDPPHVAAAVLVVRGPAVPGRAQLPRVRGPQRRGRDRALVCHPGLHRALPREAPHRRALLPWQQRQEAGGRPRSGESELVTWLRDHTIYQSLMVTRLPCSPALLVEAV